MFLMYLCASRIKDMQPDHIPYSFYPIFLQFCVALTFVVLVILGTHLLGPKQHGKRKDDSFECGLDSVGNARNPFAVKYFMSKKKKMMISFQKSCLSWQIFLSKMHLV